MKLIDVTLRDGGHAVKFNWSFKLAQEYYKILSNINKISFLELGYWKQTAKSKHPFYNLDQNKIDKITMGKNFKNISIMIDYHYCSKNLLDYPTNKQKKIGMIRMTSRKEDISEALIFAQRLKKYSKLNVSFNVFITTNYKKKELENVCKKISMTNLDFVYFADTHGDINLENMFDFFKDPIKILNKKGKGVGFHLHDHSGKAYYNFKMLKKFNIKMSDTSIRGMGKGFGNLRLENVIEKKYLVQIVEFIRKYEDKLTMYQDPYTLISSKWKVSDNYAKQARENNISIKKFDLICSKISGVKKDSFDKTILF